MRVQLKVPLKKIPLKIIPAKINPARRKPTISLKFGNISADLYRPITGQSQPAGASAYGIHNQGVQQYLPVNEKRNLTPQEMAAVEKGLKQWWPQMFPHYGTPVSDLLASPAKSGALAGAGGALASVLIAAMHVPHLLIPIGLIAGLLSGGLGYFIRKQSNGDRLDLLRRLPAGATRRDMLSDPVEQARMNRASMVAVGNTFGVDGGMLLADALVGAWAGRRAASYRPSYRYRPARPAFRTAPVRVRR